MRRGRQHEPARLLAQPPEHGVQRHEASSRIRGRQVRECVRHRLAGLARRHAAAEREVGCPAISRKNSPATYPDPPSTMVGILRATTSPLIRSPSRSASRGRCSLAADRRARPCRHRIDRGDVRALLDDVDADLIVGSRARNHRRLDAELLAQQLRAAPGADGIVGAQDHRRDFVADLGVAQDRLDAVSAEQAVTELENDRVGLLRRDVVQQIACERTASSSPWSSRRRDR